MFLCFGVVRINVDLCSNIINKPHTSYWNTCLQCWLMLSSTSSGPKIKKLFLCSTQPCMKFFSLTDIKMPMIVSILISWKVAEQKKKFKSLVFQYPLGRISQLAGWSIEKYFKLLAQTSTVNLGFFSIVQNNSETQQLARHPNLDANSGMILKVESNWSVG